MAENQDSTRQVLSFIPASLNPNAIMFNHSMGSKIKDICGRLEQLCHERIELGLQQIPGSVGTSSASAAQQRPPSSSVPTERAVYGRDKDKARILKMVLSTDEKTDDDANFRVIPIVGMAGVGKTTLAREVYNDKSLNAKDFKFDIKAWVCISDVFDVLSISKALLESITRKPCHLNTLNEVQVDLKTAVDGKRFLLVIDDVWNEDYSLWVDLKAPLLAAAPNSKMIITTRHSHVASTMGPIKHYNLKRLLDEDCWSIFIKHAYESRSLKAHQISELFRKKVVGKCGGLPLAAKSLGGLLRTTRCDLWEDILDSKIWDLPQQSGILPVLRLSYHHLPSYLKRCFAYCAISPKDYEFYEKELVFLWIGGGIIRQSKNNEQLEDLGSQCFHDLVSRSIFQPSSRNSCKFVMHDLVHDLAQLVSGETIFRLEEANVISRRFERVRHSSYVRGGYDGRSKFEVFYQTENLRTFLPIRIRGDTICSYITGIVLSDLLPKFKRLRVLSLQRYYIGELLVSFEDFKLLRYLNLADTMIRTLPESTNSLLNLEILILRNCSRLKKLPSKMRNLINLHHLDIKGANLLREMPLGMKELKNLRTLSNFIVGKGEAVSGLEDLKNLKFLGGELCISGLENVNDSQKAREATLCEKQNLKTLSLEWGSQFDNSRDEVMEEYAVGVLDKLQPHKCIKNLTIKQYNGARFPSWLGDPLFSKMEVLKLENCWNCTSLPSLGLLSSLRELTIQGLTKLKSIGSEVYGKGFSKPFQSLEILSFENLPEWEYWDTNIKGNDHADHVEIFPRLHKLSIMECPKLSGKFPDLPPSLETLVVATCQKLVVSLSGFPVLCRLEVDTCKELVCRIPVDSKLIKTMTISNSSLLITGCKGMLYGSPTDSSMLKPMTISNILEFGKLLTPGFEILETLAIGNSEQIKSWKQHGIFRSDKKPGQGLHMLAYPEEVSIEENCISLVSFPELIFLPNKLHSLRIGKSTALKSLPEAMMASNSLLERLRISRCDSLTFITRCKLPSSLKMLEILHCQNMQCLVDGEDDASSSSSLLSSTMNLKHLMVLDCPKLTSLSSGIRFLEALEYLYIRDCPKLKSIPDSLHNLNILQSIYIWNCPSLVSFPERGLPNCISTVVIANCEKLEALPNDMHRLNFLEHLRIGQCPSILSFPEEGFPTNLASLVIGGDVKMYKGLIQWGLHRLTALRRLEIDGCHDDEVECFPNEEMGVMLPSSLTHLTIAGFKKLKKLSLMTSLEYLWIKNCPNLASFPELGLPSSLTQLYIDHCPLLKKECKMDKGKEWSKIAHIPCVEIDDKFIYEPQESANENF